MKIKLKSIDKYNIWLEGFKSKKKLKSIYSVIDDINDNNWCKTLFTGRPSEVTEEQAKGFCEKTSSGYLGYIYREDWCGKTVLESFSSALKVIDNPKYVIIFKLKK